MKSIFSLSPSRRFIRKKLRTGGGGGRGGLASARRQSRSYTRWITRRLRLVSIKSGVGKRSRAREPDGNFLLTSHNNADNGCHRTRAGDSPPAAARLTVYRPDVFPRLQRRVYPPSWSRGFPLRRTTNGARN